MGEIVKGGWDVRRKDACTLSKVYASILKFIAEVRGQVILRTSSKLL